MDRTENAGYQALWTSLVPPSQHGRDELCAVGADGMRIRFQDGRELLDGDSGLWNANLGHGNTAIAEAVAKALHEASYLSIFRYEHTYARRAAEALVDLAGADHYGRVLFSTSGGSANDLVMKTARHYHALRGDHARKLVVGLRGSYHGLTYGSFSLTGENLGQTLYGVDGRLVRHVHPNDPAEIRALLERHGELVAAVVVEPVLGSGAVPLDDTYVDTLLALRDEYGFLLVADEVATGFGRTGDMFASQRWSGRPDLLVTSKGLTNGTCAASAVIVARSVADAFEEADAMLTHGETQAGTPATCAAILATIDEMRRLDAVARGRRLAERLEDELTQLVSGHALIGATTGVGLFRSIRVVTATGEPLPQTEVMGLVGRIREAGAIVHPGVHGVQLLPALTCGDEDLAELLRRVVAGIEAHAADLAGAADDTARPAPDTDDAPALAGAR
ncbi:daptide-type RiPP biosynthesis aminotransferase [Streptomyces sp. NPDC093225]|uniref:daptide-type RiPP biosynthesis aminotransferase n=1 Tax=Streptomyces sp. NPDC093225 TaxID=3366034 RepID=UPI0038223757